MNIFVFEDYKEFVRHLAKSKKKRGFYLKLAQSLKSSSTVMSQVFNGNRDLTLEQAKGLGEYLQLTSLETEYLLLMVLEKRAGTENLRNHFQKVKLSIKKKSEDLKEILPHTNILSESDKAIFYSHWLYSAIRNLSATKLNSVESLAEHLKVEREKILEIVGFLVRTGLSKKEDNRLTVGPSRTHIGKDSLLVSRHHANWRLKALERLDYPLKEDEVFFTFPASVSEKTALQIKEEINFFITRINKMVEISPSEKCGCLNIDWFQF